MVGIAICLVAVLSMGSIFIGLEASQRPALQKWGPWLVGAVACIVATLVVSTYDRNLFSPPIRRAQLSELLQTTGLMAVLAGEAVVVSRWSMRTQARRPTYLLVFFCITVVAWFLTLLVLSSVVPGS